MTTKEIIAQLFGIAGFLLAAYSFQIKDNKKFFIFQGLSGLMFFLNFSFIGAVSAALFNLTNLVRGTLFSKNNRKLWKLLITELLYTVCFVFSLTLIADEPFQIFLSSLTFTALILTSIFMWKGSGKHIRYFQLFFTSPAWLIHNIFNFTLGGIICEVLNMTSVIISFIRFGKDGFEK